MSAGHRKKSLMDAGRFIQTLRLFRGDSCSSALVKKWLFRVNTIIKTDLLEGKENGSRNGSWGDCGVGKAADG